MMRNLLPILILILVLFILFPNLFLMDGILFFHDVMHHHYPWRAYNAIQYRNLSLPLWSPLGGCGFPMLADGQSGPLYPPNVLFFSILHPFVAYNLLVIGHFFCAGLFTYALCRRLGLSRPSSLLSATMYMISGFAVSHLTFMHMISAYPWLPLAFLLIEAGRRRAIYVALAGVVIGLQFTAGHPQIGVYSLMATAFYAVWRFGPRAKRLIATLIILLFFACSIPAAQLLPTAEITSHSVREGAEESFLGWGSFPPFQAVNFIFPDFFGFDSPASHPIAYHVPITMKALYNFGGRGYWGIGPNYWEFCYYVGIIPLLLAFAAPPRRAGVFIALAVLSFLLMLGKYNPLYRLLIDIPPFSLFRFPARFGCLMTFALAVMSGYGLDNLLKNRKVARRLAILAIALALFFVIAFPVAHLILVRWSGPLETHLHETLEPPKLGRALAFIHGLRGATRLGRSENLIPIGMLVLASLLFGPAIRLPRRLLIAFILIISFGDLGSFAWGYNRATPLEAALEKPATAAVLPGEEGLWRISILDRRVPVAFERDLLTASYSMLFGISDIEFPSPLISKRLSELMDATGTSVRAVPFQDAIRSMKSNKKLLDLMNVRFILTVHKIDIPGHRLIKNGRVKVYERDGYFQRAFIVGKAIPMAAGESIQYMTGPSFEPRAEVLVEAESSSIREAEYDVRGSTCAITQYLPESVRVEAETPRGGWLVLTDTLYPGWRAVIDGREAPLYRADSIFRAVELPPGSHTVEFKYRSRPFIRGAMISLAGILVLFVWAVIPSLRRISLFPGSLGSLGVGPRYPT